MRVYLDNCCYNRPFDDQSQLRVRLEIEAFANVEITDEVREDSRELMRRGLGNADALHLACAAAADCDWFLTVDRGILKKVGEFKGTHVANPVDFILEYDHEDD